MYRFLPLDVILILAGSGGQQQPPIFVTVSEPIIQIVELGNTVRSFSLFSLSTCLICSFEKCYEKLHLIGARFVTLLSNLKL